MNETNRTKRVFAFSLILFPFLGILFLLLDMENAYITFFTFSYHIWERAITGAITALLPIKGESFVYRVGEKEMSFYNSIHIRKWKDKLPTYTPEAFETKDLKELRKTMQKSERGHLLGFLMAYIPIAVAIYLDYSISIFVVTSILSSLLDLPFIFVQRYNSRRIERMKAK